MAVAFGAVGAGANGSTSVAAVLPASISAGDMLVLVVGYKQPETPATVQTPTGWTAPANSVWTSAGAAGTPGTNDEGNSGVALFVRQADGTEAALWPGGTVTVSVTSGNSAQAAIARYTKGANTTWDYVCHGGVDNTTGTARSQTAGANPGITAGDLVVLGTSDNADSSGAWASPSLTATGATIGAVAERILGGANTTGADCKMAIHDAACTAGEASAAPVFAFTRNSAPATGSVGGTAFLRLREVAVVVEGDTSIPPRLDLRQDLVPTLNLDKGLL